MTSAHLAIPTTAMAILAAAVLALLPGRAAASDGEGGGQDTLQREPWDAAAAATSWPVPHAGLEPHAGTGEQVAEARRSTGANHLALPIAESLVVNLWMMGWNRWVGAAPWADVSLQSIGRNLERRWVLDDDQFWVNQFGHPYQGTWAFSAARSTGLGFWGSAPFAFGASALWEIAGETDPPSINDQVTTTVAGIVLGEVLHRFSEALRAEGGPWREAAASLLEPMGTLNRRLIGAAPASAAPQSRSVLSMGAMAGDAVGVGWPSSGESPRAYVGFSFTYGVPGSESLALEHPFDHFVIETGYGMAVDPDATVRARGLLAGATFELSPAIRGLHGVFLSFDFDTPGRHRVSTSAIGVGASVRAELGRGLALESDAIASAVLLGAGGVVDRGPDGEGRDYRFGPGAQSLVDLTLLAGGRASAGVALRQYLLLAAEQGGGTELLLEGSATLVLRIAGPHGLAVDVSRHLRHAHESADGGTRELASRARVSYVLLGGFTAH